MGWQKQGKGINSNTGHTAVMGLDTGKVVDHSDIVIQYKILHATRQYNLSKSNCSPLSEKVFFDFCQSKKRRSQIYSKTIVPYAFGNNDTCSDDWCGYKQGPIGTNILISHMLKIYGVCLL